MLTHQILTHLGDVLAAPLDPSAPPAKPADSSIINTAGIVKFFATGIGPILLAVLGVVILGRSYRGRVSESLTSSGVAILGVALIVGGGTLMLIGDDIVSLILQ